MIQELIKNSTALEIKRFIGILIYSAISIFLIYGVFEQMSERDKHLAMMSWYFITFVISVLSWYEHRSLFLITAMFFFWAASTTEVTSFLKGIIDSIQYTKASKTFWDIGNIAMNLFGIEVLTKVLFKRYYPFRRFLVRFRQKTRDLLIKLYKKTFKKKS